MDSVTQMISLLSYLVILVLIVFSSLSVSILCVVKVVQVFHGFSLLDPDVSVGLKLRKWFISGIAVANGLRCLSSTIEFATFAIMVVKEDRPPSSISYYNGFNNRIPFVLLVCRVLPTLFFLAYYAYLALYLAGLTYSLRGEDISTVNMLWTAANAVLSLVLLQFLLFQTNLFVLNIVCFIVVCMYASLIGWYSNALNQFYVHNQEVMSRSPTNPRKVFARLQYLSSIALSALLLYAVVYAIDISRVFHDRYSNSVVLCANASYAPNSAVHPSLVRFRSYYWQSSVDLIAVLYSEVVCAWLMVSLMSNTLVPVEARLSGAGPGAGTGAGTGTGSAASASASVGLQGASSIAMTSIGSSAAATPRSLAQQQHLQRFGNYQYQSITADEGSLP